MFLKLTNRDGTGSQTRQSGCSLGILSVLVRKDVLFLVETGSDTELYQTGIQLIQVGSEPRLLLEGTDQC